MKCKLDVNSILGRGGGGGADFYKNLFFIPDTLNSF